MLWQFDERDKILKSELAQIEAAEDVMWFSSINEAVKNIPYVGAGYGVVEAPANAIAYINKKVQVKRG
jgi:hypothetical protein